MYKQLCFVWLFSLILFAQNPNEHLRKNAILNINQVTCEIWNYGSLSKPGNRITNFVWNGLGYGYEYGIFVGAEVEVPYGSHPDVTFMQDDSGNAILNPQGDTIWVAHVISDGLISNGGETHGSQRWGWNPIVSSFSTPHIYMDPFYDYIPRSVDPDLNNDGKPDSWPSDWWIPDSSRYLWPGHWYKGNKIGDMESIFGMDDRDNREFEYFPFASDSTFRGLGIEIESRLYQVQDFYEDIIFATYRIRNISEKDLNKVVFGLWGDPHIGGNNNYTDDMHSYCKNINLVYAYDYDGISDIPGITPGYFGTLFLQTAGNDTDNIDNDNDGLIDESQFNGIDDDSDWDSNFDDVGEDGIANTGDTGEGDGVPTLGEPNFEYKDCDEVDQIGLTSVQNPLFSSTRINNDEQVWSQVVKPGLFDSTQIPGDYIYTGGSGYFNLPQGREIMISLAFIFADDLNTLREKSQKAQNFYNLSMGSQVSTKPLTITSPMAGDRFENDFSLQWNSGNFDPVAELELAYSTDNGKYWHPAIDGISNSGSELIDISNLPNSAFYKLRLRAMQPNGYGEYESNGFFSIDHSGSANVPPELIFEVDPGSIFSDIWDINWFVADVDSDQVDVSLIIQSPVSNDTIYNLYNHYSLNTRLYPNNHYEITIRASDGNAITEASQYVYFSNSFHQISDSLIIHTEGNATGKVWANVHDFSNVTDHQYEITFKDSTEKTYSVTDLNTGQIKIIDQQLQIYPAFGLQFDGVELSFEDHILEIDTAGTGWSPGSVQYPFDVQAGDNLYPADIVIQFFDTIVDTSAVTNVAANFKVFDLSHDSLQLEFEILDISPSNNIWDLGESIYIIHGTPVPANIAFEVSFVDTFITQLPGAGDFFHIQTFKPFTNDDKYVIDMSPLSVLKGKNNDIPNSFKLYQNYPNPFNGNTTIQFYLTSPAKVKLTIFDILGRKIKELTHSKFKPGMHQLNWTGNNEIGKQVASGVYFYQIEFVGKRKILKTQKMLYLK